MAAALTPTIRPARNLRTRTCYSGARAPSDFECQPFGGRARRREHTTRFDDDAVELGIGASGLVMKQPEMTRTAGGCERRALAPTSVSPSIVPRKFSRREV